MQWAKVVITVWLLRRFTTREKRIQNKQTFNYAYQVQRVWLIFESNCHKTLKTKTNNFSLALMSAHNWALKKKRHQWGGKHFVDKLGKFILTNYTHNMRESENLPSSNTICTAFNFSSVQTHNWYHYLFPWARGVAETIQKSDFNNRERLPRRNTPP